MFDEFNREVVSLITGGSVGVIPTDTVYGVVCLAGNPEAVDRLYKLKHRRRKPGTIVAHDVQQLIDLGIKKMYLRVAEQFWPASISVVLPHHLDYLSQGLGSQPFRIPDNKKLLSLLAKTGPLLTSSANPPDEPIADTVAKAKAYFHESVDYYVDGGNLSGSLASTIVKVVDDAVVIVRQGREKIDPRLLS